MVRDDQLIDLLEQADVRLRGAKRGDCPKCGGRRTISFTDECFHCHKCAWGGNAITLARELGLAISKPTAVELSKRRTVATEARRVRVWWCWRWAFLRDLNWLLLEIECLARESGQEHLRRGETVPESIWASLDFALSQQRKLWPELLLFGGPQSGSVEPDRWAGIIVERYRRSKRRTERKAT